MTYSATRIIAVGPAKGDRVAVTFKMLDQTAAKLGIDEMSLRPVLSMALSAFTQELIDPEVGNSAFPHPKDTSLFQRHDGGLVRSLCKTPSDVETMQDRGFRYLSHACDQHGHLLPSFWSVPLIASTKPHTTVDHLTVNIERVPEMIAALRAEMAKLLRQEAESESELLAAKRLTEIADIFEAGGRV